MTPLPDLAHDVGHVPPGQNSDVDRGAASWYSRNSSTPTMGCALRPFNNHRVCFAFVSRWARWLHVAQARARGVKPTCEVGVQARDVPSLSDRAGDSGLACGEKKPLSHRMK